jgi:DNA-binding transcriptional LysR family regulator
MDARILTRLGTLRQVEIFMKVAEKNSIARAAEELHLTQPSVSNQIKRLGESLNIELYEVIGKKIYLTQAGKEVVHTGKAIFESISGLNEKINDLKGVKSGLMKIAVDTTAQYFLPHILGPFCKQYPDIDVEFKVGNRAQIIDRLKANLDDFYLFSDPPENLDIARYQFLPNPLAVIASVDNPLSKRKNLKWQDLSGEKFLMREHGSMTIESNEAIKLSVIENMGISILSAYVLSKSKEDGLEQLRIPNFPIMSHWYIIHLREKKLSLIAQHFLEFVLNKHQDVLPMKKIEAHIKRSLRKSM